MIKRVLICALFLSSFSPILRAQNPEPAEWFAGDMHVHRSCGGSPVSLSSIYNKMSTQNLAAVSLLADMGNGEVQDPATDLPLVNGQDASVSTPGRIVHWDAEWHWDATYSQYGHQALGGHVVALGLREAHQIWAESTSSILDWAHQQNAIAGFVHMQYLDDGFPQYLTCCTPVEYPVEVALGGADFVSEDVNGSDSAINAYYRLLNSGFRPSFIAGTDYPCNDGSTVGSPLTYVRVAGGQMTYRNWVEGMARGRTVVSRNGHAEFLDLKVNGTAGPGDEINLTGAGSVQVSVQWTAAQNLTGTIEIISNGVVVASRQASVSSATPATLTTTINLPKSGWIAARRSGSNGHMVHTAAVFVLVDHAPIRVNSTDPQFYVDWMDNLLAYTSVGGMWNWYFPTTLSAVQARYQQARAVYQQVAAEALGTAPSLTSLVVSPAGAIIAPGATQQFTATGNYSNGTSLNLTGQVTWSSSNSVVAPVTMRGLVSGASSGTAVISATMGATTGSTAVTVQTPPLSISTQSLPGGSVSVGYTATVAAAGGTPPYTWSLSAGSLPPGLSLNSATGLISGTPTTAGTFAFTARVSDAASQTAPRNFSVTIVAAPTWSCPCTLWPSTVVPAIGDSGPDSAVELGVKFRADAAGFITGIRFYKGTGNTGTHIGNLWSASGTLLGTAVFSNETSSGWQQVNFSSPVPVAANTYYVASYHTGSGHYADDQYYFANGVDNAPLHAPADGVNGGNGLYAYGSSSSFPSQSWHSSNYWVDAVYVPAGPDTTPPTVVSLSPTNGASGVFTNSSVTAMFVEALDASTVNTQTFQLLDAANAVVPATVAYDSSSYTATLTPVSTLSTTTTYTAVVRGGAADPRVKDMAGNALAGDMTWSFTTAAPPPPPPNEGPGGPILIVSSAANPFSRYYTEILRNEGLNEFTAADLSLVTATTLASYDVVVLGDVTLTAEQVAMFSDWVSGGGNLIAMHPDKQLAGLLGLADAGATRQNAYLAMNTSSGPGVGLVGQSIQYHGSADLYSLNGATALATLYATASSPTANPAVTLRAVGAGQAAAFTYDLARSVVYTRQGNPAWSGQWRDGYSLIRSDNLFFGDASFDPQPDWVDFNKISIPQADEQQRLLANLILQMNRGKQPLPRFWYLPRGLKAAVVLTGDDHGAFYGGGATAARFDQYVAASPAGCSVDDWQCVRATAYVFPPVIAANPLTNTQAAAYTAQGFEVGVHVNSDPDCSDWTLADLDTAYTSAITSFRGKYTSAPPPQTHRMHCVSWSDYDSQPQVELSHGIRLDTTYYYWPDSWILDRPGLFTGSGMPMRFAKRDGTLLDVYQAATQMTDESGQSYPENIDALLDGALGPGGYYGVFTANMHNDTEDSSGADAIVASAQGRGVPIISARQLLTWLDGRNGSSFSSLSRNGNLFHFTIQVGAGARGLQALLPADAATGGLSAITFNNAPLAYSVQTIKGVRYAVFPASAGDYIADYSGTPAILVASVSLEPSQVTGGGSVATTVTLSGPAPGAGAAVTLSSSNGAVAAVPATVSIAGGASSATFTVSTSAVAASTVVSISAAYNGSNASSALTVTPVIGLASISVSPATVAGGSAATGTATLNIAPFADTVVSLQSSNTSVATVPATVTVAGGSTSATFAIATTAVATSTSVNISGTYDATTRSATLAVNAPALSTLTLSPTIVAGGQTSTGTVTLDLAPAVDTSISLQSNNTSVATVPATVTVAAGTTSANFAIATVAVATNTTVSISATYNGTTRSAALTVNAPVLSTLTLNPATVVGSQTSTATVTLSAAAPTGGIAVSLSSANPAVASVPATVSIAAGSTTATFTVTTVPITTTTNVVITASFNGVNRTASLRVNAVALSTLTLSPTSVIGGNTSTGTVTLTAAAPAGGLSLTLSSSITSAATVPATVTVAGGATSATFPVTTYAVAARATPVISATFGTVTRTRTLTVNVPALSVLTLSPTSVKGGTNSTGTVTLTGIAPAAGFTVSLTSANTNIARVPASVVVPAGAKTASFTITTLTRTSSTTVRISATANSVTRSATLTVTP